MLRRLFLRRDMSSSAGIYSKYANSPHVGFITSEKVSKWATTTVLWGFGAGVAIALFGQSIPRLRNDIFSKIPIIGNYWSTKIPPEDNPF